MEDFAAWEQELAADREWKPTPYYCLFTEVGMLALCNLCEISGQSIPQVALAALESLAEQEPIERLDIPQEYNDAIKNLSVATLRLPTELTKQIDEMAETLVLCRDELVAYLTECYAYKRLVELYS